MEQIGFRFGISISKLSRKHNHQHGILRKLKFVNCVIDYPQNKSFLDVWLFHAMNLIIQLSQYTRETHKH